MFSIHLLDLEVQEFSEGEVANVYRGPSVRFEQVLVMSEVRSAFMALFLHRLEIRTVGHHLLD